MEKLNLKLNPLRTLITQHGMANVAKLTELSDLILLQCLNIIAINSIFSILAAFSNL